MYDSKYNLKGAIVCGSVLSIATYANIRNIFNDTRRHMIRLRLLTQVYNSAHGAHIRGKSRPRMPSGRASRRDIQI